MFDEHLFLGVAFWSGVVILFVFLLYVAATRPKCKHGHYEKSHHEAYTLLMPMMVGKSTILIPQYHGAYDSNDWHCDEYCSKNDQAKECK